MKLSDVTIADLKGYANCYHDLDDNLFGAILVAGKQFISNYTGIPLTSTDPDVDTLDNHEEMSIALLLISNEMYDNRMVTVENNKIGFVIRQLLDAHSVNLL
jgi:hypothetical protein